MQFKKSAVVGVLIVLYLSTDSLCHYIPERNATTTTTPKNGTSEKIQICGNDLTTFIIEACDGVLGSFDQANYTRNSVQTKITEDCCDQGCHPEYLQSYCGETLLFDIRKTLRGKLLNKLTRKWASRAEVQEATPKEGGRKEVSEVRVREGKLGRKRRKKRKNSFKWKCAYKSFGHYLLKLDRRGRARHNTAKASNTVNRTWPSIEIGTISPEVDKFGGQPIVVMRKNKSKSS